MMSQSAEEGQAREDHPMTVWIYVDTSKEVGDADHLKVFANEDAAEAWFRDNDPEGVAFEYPSSDPWVSACNLTATHHKKFLLSTSMNK